MGLTRSLTLTPTLSLTLTLTLLLTLTLTLTLTWSPGRGQVRVWDLRKMQCVQVLNTRSETAA